MTNWFSTKLPAHLAPNFDAEAICTPSPRPPCPSTRPCGNDTYPPRTSSSAAFFSPMTDLSVTGATTSIVLVRRAVEVTDLRRCESA